MFARINRVLRFSGSYDPVPGYPPAGQSFCHGGRPGIRVRVGRAYAGKAGNRIIAPRKPE